MTTSKPPSKLPSHFPAWKKLAPCFVILAASLALTRHSQAAITFDSADSYTSGGASVKAVTIIHTVSGTNTFLIMQSQVDTLGGSATITSAAYNGVSLFRIIKNSSGDTNQTTEMWGLVNPASGPGSLVVKWGSNHRAHIGVLSYQGVDQTTPTGATTFLTSGNSSQSAALTLVTTTNNSEIVALFTANGADTITPGLGQNQRWTQRDHQGTDGDDKMALLAGANSMTYTISASDKSAIEAIELIPAGLVPTNTATNTATKTATNTVTNTVTNTATKTATNTVTQTPTNTATLTPTNTMTSSATKTSTNTAVNTATNTSTVTATNTATNTPTNTATGTIPPTNTFTNTPTKTSTDTATQTATYTPTATATDTTTQTSTMTSTNTPTYTTTNTPTTTQPNTPTDTSTNTSTPTPTNTKTFTNTPTITDTPTITATPTVTPLPISGVWPNPFTPMLSTNNWTNFTVPTTHSAGEFIILTLHQRPVRTVKFDPNVPIGWDGKNDSGDVVPSGLYLYLLNVDSRTRRGTIAVLR